jgi:hypothetical protein
MFLGLSTLGLEALSLSNTFWFDWQQWHTYWSFHQQNSLKWNFGHHPFLSACQPLPQLHKTCGRASKHQQDWWPKFHFNEFCWWKDQYVCHCCQSNQKVFDKLNASKPKVESPKNIHKNECRSDVS